MIQYAYLIPLFPLVAFTIIIFFGKRIPKLSALISISAIFGSFCIALGSFIDTVNGSSINSNFATWLTFGNYQLKFGFMVDPLTAMMLMVVTFIGLLIQIYSIGYMQGDKREPRFFAYMSLFSFSMLGLVLANNFVEIFIFWELVGLCSYLLISFWFERTSAANAGKKAFITTRIGDTGLLIGILILFYATGTVHFAELTESVVNQSGHILTIAAILIFCGAVGKSAQFPLHVWLPDAMEGPTPVSALIHAATMVAAGVYLVARSFILFHFHQEAMLVVAYIGTITAFMAATIALVQNDIKRILAYSTISQLGLMFLGLGVGSSTAGSFHLMTHAFFKALLFLGAGSVIHGTGTQDIREMGGLYPKMKTTAITFFVACLAIAGIPPLSGFWSKDEILLEAYNSNHFGIYLIGTVTAFITAFYIFRLFFMTFTGTLRNHEIHAHESPKVMTIPLILLAVGAALVGLPGSPLMGNWFQSYIHFGNEHIPAFARTAPTVSRYIVMAISVLVGTAGFAVAYLAYGGKTPAISATAIASRFPFVYRLLLNKYYFDELYDLIIIRPFLKMTEIASAFDQIIIDGSVNGVAWVTILISKLKNLIDIYIVDGLVNAVGWITQNSSRLFRRTQTGIIQNYTLFLILGLTIIILIKLFLLSQESTGFPLLRE
ncbi:MAG: NADH-quinone oxidoreductase subunit L [bacterium]|nr:NADH-quinone oxidoreductase subunit L [bacterium]